MNHLYSATERPAVGRNSDTSFVGINLIKGLLSNGGCQKDCYLIDSIEFGSILSRRRQDFLSQNIRNIVVGNESGGYYRFLQIPSYPQRPFRLFFIRRKYFPPSQHKRWTRMEFFVNPSIPSHLWYKPIKLGWSRENLRFFWRKGWNMRFLAPSYVNDGTAVEVIVRM